MHRQYAINAVKDPGEIRSAAPKLSGLKPGQLSRPASLCLAPCISREHDQLNY